MSVYAKLISERLAVEGHPEADPRHVEAFMRVAHGTLDALSPSAFAEEVRVALDCIDAGGAAVAEECARSFGL